MRYLLGTDEAGYGPNLGPLVVAATLWRIEDDPLCAIPDNDDLYERLACGVTSDPRRSDRLAMADSKQLYSAGASLALLERGVFAALRLLHRSPQSWQGIWPALVPGHVCELPWHGTFDCALPLANRAEMLASVTQGFSLALTSSKVELLEVRATVLHPAEFNARCKQLSSKGAVLSSATLGLVRELLRGRAGPAKIVCDKHGGRNRYAPLVWQELASEEANSNRGFPVQTLLESRGESRYRWLSGTHEREIRFVSKGERFLPAALASMVAKYLRELAMLAFNDFWGQRVTNLKPTAGYPQDAVRFWQAIEPELAEAKLGKHELWRNK